MRSKSAVLGRVIVVVTLLHACSGEPAGPAPVRPAPPVVSPPSLSIRSYAPWGPIAVGDSALLTVVALNTAGAEVALPPVSWSLAGPGQATLRQLTASTVLVTAIAPGWVYVTVTTNSRSTDTYDIDVQPTRPAVVPVDSSPIILDDPRLLVWSEYGSVTWVPSMNVRSRSDRGGRLLGFRLQVATDPTGWSCFTEVGRSIHPQEGLPLITEYYGEWSLYFSGGGPIPMTDSTLIHLYVLDELDRPFTVRAMMPTVPGGQPGTFTPRQSEIWTCG